MKKLLIAALMFVVFASAACAIDFPAEGNWIRYKLLPAWEWTPPAVDDITITVGPEDAASGARWWQLYARKPKDRWFVIQVLSDRVPMTTENGDIGEVYRYIFKQQGTNVLEYVDARTGKALLPKYGFRDGLVPTPRSTHNIIGCFFGTGSYIGQPLTAKGHGSRGKWQDLGEVKKLEINTDLLILTCRWHRDDGRPAVDRIYNVQELTAEDYDRMIEAGFNVFPVNTKHVEHVRERPVFFVKESFAGDRYPELLYRSNWWGPRNYTDEPASRLDATECRTVYDAVNALKARNKSYYYEPGSYTDGIVNMIHDVGYRLGDWYPKQTDIPVAETYHETAFYQISAGGAGIWHEGRYDLESHNAMLQTLLGPGIEMTVPEMLHSCYAFLRGAARCFDCDWGMSIYGQTDYSIAPQAIKQAYDMGTQVCFYWSGDGPKTADDHHLPHAKQLELTKMLRAYEKDHPNRDRRAQIRSAKVAIAVPEGYLNYAHMMWWTYKFDSHRINEHGVRYGDVMAEVWYQIYSLARQGVDYDCVVDMPEVVDKGGYERVIRIFADGTTNLPQPVMPKNAPGLSISPAVGVPQAEVNLSPRATAKYMKPGSVKIDGELSDWSGAGWISLDKKLLYAEDAPYGGAGDLSARVAFACDDEAIYVAAEVTDDVHCAEYDGDDIWNSDSLQIGFDPLLNATEDGFYGIDDSELGFALIDDEPYAHLWHQRICGSAGPMPHAQTAIVRDGSRTRYEAKIPYGTLLPLTAVYPGGCRMNVVINDSDGEARKGALVWTGGLADGKRVAEWNVVSFAGVPGNAAPPAVYLTPRKQTVRRGEDVVFNLNTGSRAACDAQVLLTVRHANTTAPPAVARVKIVPGTAEYSLQLSTSGLQPSSYYADITVRVGDKTAAKQSIKFFVLP